jgi:hypothetical protein
MTFANLKTANQRKLTFDFVAKGTRKLLLEAKLAKEGKPTLVLSGLMKRDNILVLSPRS